MSDPADAERVVVAQFGAAHGVRGEIRLKSYTEVPLTVADYGPLESADGRVFVVASARPAAGKSQDMLVVAVEGVTTREEAAVLNGLELSVPRARLPATDTDEYYCADLVGLDVVMKDGTGAGTIVAVRNFGAGDLVEVAPARGPTFLVPFTCAAVPEVDISGGRIVIDPPSGLLGDDQEKDQAR